MTPAKDRDIGGVVETLLGLRRWLWLRHWLVVGFTPKALANLSPGLERSDNPGLIT